MSWTEYLFNCWRRRYKQRLQWQEDRNCHQWNNPLYKQQLTPHDDGDDDLDEDYESRVSFEGGEDIHLWSAPQSNHQNPSHGDDGDDSCCEQNTIGDGGSTAL